MTDVPSPETFQRLQRLTDYEKLKRSYMSICRMIEGMGNNQSPPRNPRQDMEQQYDKHCASIWWRQKMNLEEKLRVLENSIKKDIEDSKNEL